MNLAKNLPTKEVVMKKLNNDEYLDRMLKLANLLDNIQVKETKHPFRPEEKVTVFYSTEDNWEYYYSPSRATNVGFAYAKLLEKAGQIFLKETNVNVINSDKVYDKIMMTAPKILQEVLMLIKDNNQSQIDKSVYYGLGLDKEEYRGKDKKIAHLEKLLAPFQSEQLPE